MNPFINRHFTSAARHTCEMKYRIAKAKAAFHTKRTISQANWTAIKGRTSKVQHLEHGFVWCWRRMERISWNNAVKNEVLHGVKGTRNTLCTINRRKDN